MRASNRSLPRDWTKMSVLRKIEDARTLPGHATLCVHRPGEGGRRIKAGGLAERLPGVGGRDRELRAFGTLAALQAGQASVCASVL